MRYLIIDTTLDVSAVFLLGLIATWMLHSCYVVFLSWWREGKRDVHVAILDHDDPRLTDIKEG